MRRNKFELPLRLTSRKYLSSMPYPVISAKEISAAYPLHWHEFYELEFIYSGEGFYRANGVEYSLSKGDIFLLTPVDFHEVAPREDSCIKLYNIKFSEDMLNDRIRKLLFGSERIITARFSGSGFSGINTEIERLFKEYCNPGIGSDIIIQGGLERILIELIRKNSRQICCKPEDPQFNSLQMSLIYIHNHFREKITLDVAASKAHLSPNYFSECFHKTVGTSFQNYLQSLRLEFARSLLAVSQLPVLEICYASGFNSLPHFIRAFKKAFDKSPAAFRKTIA